MVVMPAATGVASPSLPAAVLIVATLESLEFHVTSVVMFCIVESEYVPVAVYCTDIATGVDALAGEMVIAVNVAGVTVSVVLPLAPLRDAVIVAIPTLTDVARPFES